MFSDKSFLYTLQRTRRKNANANAKNSRFSGKIRNASEKFLQTVAPSVVYDVSTRRTTDKTVGCKSVISCKYTLGKSAVCYWKLIFRKNVQHKTPQ